MAGVLQKTRKSFYCPSNQTKPQFFTDFTLNWAFMKYQAIGLESPEKISQKNILTGT